MERPQLTEVEINAVISDLQTTTAYRLDQKGRGILVSRHEMKGVVGEEVEELNRAVREDPLTRAQEKRHGSPSSVEDELIDIAVACIVSLASIKTGQVQW